MQQVKPAEEKGMQMRSQVWRGSTASTYVSLGAIGHADSIKSTSRRLIPTLQVLHVLIMFLIKALHILENGHLTVPKGRCSVIKSTLVESAHNPFPVLRIANNAIFSLLSCSFSFTSFQIHRFRPHLGNGSDCKKSSFPKY